MKIIIDSENPVVTNDIADAIWQSITKQAADNQSLFNDIEKINIKIHVEKRKLDPEKTIHWSNFEGQEIEVFCPCSEVWMKRTLYKYDSSIEQPFICFLDNKDGVLSWKDGRLIEKKQPEVDWSKVDIGTKVIVADSKETLKDSILDAIFISFDPKDNVFWTLLPNTGKQPKHFLCCKLAESMKLEWEKK